MTSDAPSPQRDGNADAEATSSKLEPSPEPQGHALPNGESPSPEEPQVKQREATEPPVTTTSAESSPEPGETTSASPSPSGANPPLPSEAPPLPHEAPPLPNEAPPAAGDDGWDFQWDPTTQAYFFYNRFTGATQWDNPRVATSSATATAAPSAPGTTSSAAALTAPPPLPTDSRPPAGGYNPAIHGDYDPTAWYAQTDPSEEEAAAAAGAPGQMGEYAAAAAFNRFTGQFQAAGEGPDRHTDEAKSRRQMNAFFDVDAAANAHDGRSLKAERAGKKLSKTELKQFKEKRKARKEEKRRAWLRD